MEEFVTRFIGPLVHVRAEEMHKPQACAGRDDDRAAETLPGLARAHGRGERVLAESAAGEVRGAR